jgi:hypothetical protein
MALISKPDEAKLNDIKIKLSTNLLNEVEQYCEWAGFKNDLTHFFVNAATIVLAKDKDWKAFKKTKKKAHKID